jgi:nucleotide-binding universal stress UspA family protein
MTIALEYLASGIVVAIGEAGIGRLARSSRWTPSLQMEKIMSKSTRKIIVPTDFSDLSDMAARSAAALAMPEAASIHLLHVIRLPFLHTTYDLNVPESIWEVLRNGTHERLDETTRELEQLGVIDVNQIVSESLQPAEAIVQSVQELDADLVVMATHGRQGIEHALLGSVTEQTVRTSPVPVLSVKEPGISEAGIQRILLAIDFSSYSDQVISLACSFAENHGAHVDVLHVLDETPDYIKFLSAEVVAFEERARAMAGDRLEGIGATVRAANLSVKTHLRKGRAVDVLVSEADRLKTDVIVMGTHGHTGFTRVALGSVAARTLRLARCSVLTIRPIEAQT